MKFKSYGFWTTLAASAVMVFGVLSKTFGFEISSEIVSDIILGIAGVLVVLGIVKMPKDKDLNQATDQTELEEADEQTQENNQAQINDTKKFK